MKRLLFCLVLMLSTLDVMAQKVECQTYHYATTEGQELMLDIYSLDAVCSEPRPCMIFAFGGGFVMGERNHEYYARYFDTLAKAGIVVASIDYRLGLKNPPKEGGIKTMIGAMQHAVDIAVEDIYSATCFVLINSQKLNIDPKRIMLSGSSAGAIAALQAEWNKCNDADIANVLPKDFSYAAVVACAGAIFSTEGKPKFKCEPAPMLLFHGTSDGNVPYNRSSLFGIGFYGSKYIAKQLDKMNAPYWFYSAEYADHKIAGLPLWYQCDLILQFINDYVVEGSRMQITNNVEYLPRERHQTYFRPREYLQNNYKRREGV